MRPSATISKTPPPAAVNVTVADGCLARIKSRAARALSALRDALVKEGVTLEGATDGGASPVPAQTRRPDRGGAG